MSILRRDDNDNLIICPQDAAGLENQGLLERIDEGTSAIRCSVMFCEDLWQLPDAETLIATDIRWFTFPKYLASFDTLIHLGFTNEFAEKVWQQYNTGPARSKDGMPDFRRSILNVIVLSTKLGKIWELVDNGGMDENADINFSQDVVNLGGLMPGTGMLDESFTRLEVLEQMQRASGKRGILLSAAPRKDSAYFSERKESSEPKDLGGPSGPKGVDKDVSVRTGEGDMEAEELAINHQNVI